MANYNNPNAGLQQQNSNNFLGQQQQIPFQFPYGNNNMLLNNSLYDNYMARMNSSNQFLKCRPVSSKDEARAFQIDLDGSLWVFTDVGNDKIYTKQINNDGTATFKTYTFTKDENPYNTSQYVTKEEFNKVIQNLMAAMQSMNSQGPVTASNNTIENSKVTSMNF